MIRLTRKERKRYRQLLLGSLPFITLIAIWHYVSVNGIVAQYFLPTPSKVAEALISMFLDGSLWPDLKASLFRVGFGYFLAILVGLPVGVALGGLKTFRTLFEPINNFVRYTPLPAFIPLVVLWVGIGEANPITVIFLGVFWSFVVLVGDAISNVPKQYVELARTMGIGKLGCLVHVTVPHALPSIYDGMRVSAGWAWSSLVLAEIVGANIGIGHMLMESQRFLQTANVIGGIVLVGLLGVLTDVLFEHGYAQLFPWTERVIRQSSYRPN